MCWIFFAVRGLSTAVVRGAYSLVALHRLLIVASLVGEHRLYTERASVVVASRLSCPMAHGIFPDQESNPCPLHW